MEQEQDSNQNTTDVSQPRRSSRRSAKKVEETSNLNRGKKRKASVSVEDLYCQIKTSPSKCTPLQTIYEAPKSVGRGNKATFSYMGGLKVKRLCAFPSIYNPSKTKAKFRKARANAMKRNGVYIPTGKVYSISDVDKALECISADENGNSNVICNPINTAVTTICSNNIKSSDKCLDKLNQLHISTNKTHIKKPKHSGKVDDLSFTESQSNLSTESEDLVKEDKFICHSDANISSGLNNENAAEDSFNTYDNISTCVRTRRKRIQKSKAATRKRRVSGVMKPLYIQNTERNSPNSSLNISDNSPLSTNNSSRIDLPQTDNNCEDVDSTVQDNSTPSTATGNAKLVYNETGLDVDMKDILNQSTNIDKHTLQLSSPDQHLISKYSDNNISLKSETNESELFDSHLPLHNKSVFLSTSQNDNLTDVNNSLKNCIIDKSSTDNIEQSIATTPHSSCTKNENDNSKVKENKTKAIDRWSSNSPILSGQIESKCSLVNGKIYYNNKDPITSCTIPFSSEKKS